MSKIKKDKIPIEIKRAVWNKYNIYSSHKEITQCRTCDNLIMIPEALRSFYDVSYDIKQIYINGKIKTISGVAEFGHIISEKNGGMVNEDNLIVQCKLCNTRLGSKNIEKSDFAENCEMIDVFDSENIEMGENYDKCHGHCSSGQICKNKTIFNRKYCHIHLNK